jgi:hypothetical protein
MRLIKRATDRRHFLTSDSGVWDGTSRMEGEPSLLASTFILNLKLGPKPGTTNFAYPEADLCKAEELPNEGAVAIPGFGEITEIWATAEVISKLGRVHQSAELHLVGCVEYSDATITPRYRTNVSRNFQLCSDGIHSG